MHPILRRLRPIAGLGAALFSGSCNTVLCAGVTYDRGVGECAADRYVIQVSLPVDRTDLRDPTAGLQVDVQAMAKDTNTTYDVTEVMSVQLALDGADSKTVQASIGADKRSVVVSRMPECLALGPLKAVVTLPGLPAAQTSGLHRVFRSPKFGAPELVAQTFNTYHASPINARLAVQIVSPVGGSGQVLVTEETAPTPVYRWLDLYSQGPGGMLGYANELAWKPTTLKLQESPTALLTFAQGAVITYDTVKANKLAVVPVSGMSQPGFDANIPVDAQALAACGEEPAFLLARANEVRAFRVDAAAATVSYLGSLMTTGLPVIAARDVMALVPGQRSSDYFGVVWENENGGKGTLLKLAKTPMGVPSGIAAGPDVTGIGVGSVSAAALADLDSDGLQDLVVVKSADGALLWSPQHPDGSFAAATALGISALGATSVSVGDINGDTLPDLAIATSDKRLLIFRNQL